AGGARQGVRTAGTDRACASGRAPHAAGHARRLRGGRRTVVCAVRGSQRLGFLERILLEASRGPVSAYDSRPSAAILVLRAGSARRPVSLDAFGRSVVPAKDLPRRTHPLPDVLAPVRAGVFFRGAK